LLCGDFQTEFGYDSLVIWKFFICAVLGAFAVFSGDAAEAAKTMRVDYFHTGNATEEIFSIDQIYIEPLPWPGNPHKKVDQTNLGKYFFEVRDRESRQVLYSRGFNTIYGEWETTDEAKSINRTFSESFRFPAPEHAVEIVLKKRDSKNQFEQIWKLDIDPKDMFINRASFNSPAPVIELERNGSPEEKVDFLILGDGYTKDELEKFEKDARRMLEKLFATSPFKERRKDFNIWAICPPSAESGISRPSLGIYRDSPLNASYDAFGSERYVLTYDNQGLRKVAQFAPYEFVEILANSRTYGGGGIFNLYGTVSVDSAQAGYIFVHEFGHHFAGLADEYYTSPVAYTLDPNRIEPWEPNVTTLQNPTEIKWKQLLTPGVEIPTPWNKKEYDDRLREYQKRRTTLRAEKKSEEQMEQLFRELREFEIQFFAAEPNKNKVGAFEGADYQATGFYRPQLDCIMFTRSPDFCTVCRAAINRIIDLYVAQ
jgi:hypothetical protein